MQGKSSELERHLEPNMTPIDQRRVAWVGVTRGGFVRPDRSAERGGRAARRSRSQTQTVTRAYGPSSPTGAGIEGTLPFPRDESVKVMRVIA